MRLDHLGRNVRDNASWKSWSRRRAGRAGRAQPSAGEDASGSVNSVDHCTGPVLSGYRSTDLFRTRSLTYLKF